MNTATAEVKKGYANTPKGQIHFREAGEGSKVVLMLHQTPRSSDEFAEVLPIVAREGIRAFAMDTIGFGESYHPTGKQTIEGYAQGVLDFLDALKINKASLLGHHTGAVIAIEVATSNPGRIEKLILSACPYFDSARRKEIDQHPVMDSDGENEDGSYLLKLWQRRQAFYPKGRTDLLTRFIGDALLARESRIAGHEAVRDFQSLHKKYRMIQCPTLLVCGTEDPFSNPVQSKLKTIIQNSRMVPIEGGTVAVPDQMPENFARSFISFLKE